MIDMNKQYTYNGKPVRIYADGSDTVGGWIHCAILTEIEAWESKCLLADSLVEVWQPKEGELVWCWNSSDDLPTLDRYDKCLILEYKSFAPFTGTLPEAFKGL